MNLAERERIRMEGCAAQGANEGFEFPRHFQQPTVPQPPRRWLLLVGLLLACFLPRAWEAAHWNTLWADTVYYLHCCQALEAGQVQEAFADLNLNIYPVILLGLRRTGLDWTVTGEWWSLLMATATVLPLFGWCRRQFDDRIAILACLVYAVHSTLVAYTPLIIRDPTFWFLFMLSVYLIWRAVTEVRAWLFLAAGLALTLAVHTRFEGWILLVPLVGWSAGRLRASLGRRRQLVLGTMGTLAVIPLSIVLVNLTVLRDSPCWSIIRSVHLNATLALVGDLWETKAETVPTAPVPPVAPAADASAVSNAVSSPAAAVDSSVAPREEVSVTSQVLSALVLTRRTAVRMMKMYAYPFGFLALCGIWGWRRLYVRYEHQVVLWMCLALVALVWVRLAITRIDIRYFAPMILVSFPWMALGIFWLADGIVSLTSRRHAWSPSKRLGLIGTLLLGAFLLGLPEKCLPAGVPMQHEAAIGQWVFDHFGPQRLIYANLRDELVLEHYSQGQLLRRYCELDENPYEIVPPLLKERSPEVVVFWAREGRHEDSWEGLAQMLADEESTVYRAVPRTCLPAESGEVYVLVRQDVLRCDAAQARQRPDAGGTVR